MSNNLSVEDPLKTLTMALSNRKYNHKLIHHSGRGLQYCSSEYIIPLTLSAHCHIDHHSPSYLWFIPFYLS